MKLNPWLREKLRGVDPKRLRVIVEVDPKYFDEALIQLRRMGVRVVSTSFDRFITVVVPDVATIEQIEKLPYVVEIHYDAPVWIKPVPLLPLSLSFRDPLIGEIRISSIEIPSIKPFGPVVIPGGLGLPRIKRGDVEIIPSSETIRIVVDVDTFLSGRGVRVAVIDTGVTPWHPQLQGKMVSRHTTVPEVPDDLQAHGMWVSTLIAGSPFATRFGRIEGIAPSSDLIGIKALTTAGFGSTSSILRAMEIAMYVGAKIVNMSLGGVQQGPVDHDPLCKAVKILASRGVIPVVAAGNEGPGEWTISSPGVCPDSLTVGAISPMYQDIAFYSSRGPSGEWYRDHRSDWSEDYSKYGDLLVKVDVVAPGGGPARRDQKPIDMIYSGVTGWFDGFYDLFADLAEPMRGTSMATPHVAGLLALVSEAYGLVTVNEIKKILIDTAEIKEKSPVYGWGLITLSRFR